MSIASTVFVLSGLSNHRRLLAALAFLAAITTPLLAQQIDLDRGPITAGEPPAAATPEVAQFLPDAPSASLWSTSSEAIAPSGSAQTESTPHSSVIEDWQRPTTATTRAKFIFPGQIAPKITARDKVLIGVIHGVSPYSITGWIVAAEYEQVTNGTPNYGTDTGAYGQRLGAAALRGYSEEILGTSVLSPILHEDPRYYKMGSRHNVALRTLYSITRTIITRDDNGHFTPNFSLVGGNLAGAALTNAYYPPFNRGFNQTLKTFEGSMGGAAFGFFADEFIKDKVLNRAMIAVHLKQ